jgi:hypothetical protein
MKKNRLLIILLVTLISLSVSAQPLKCLLVGYTIDLETKQPVPNAKVALESNSEVMAITYTDSTGWYGFDSSILQLETDYEIHVYANGFLNAWGFESTKNLKRSTKIEHNLCSRVPATHQNL